MAVATERARAKVNLTLHVLGRRTDGYHDLESLVAFADCADSLSFVPADHSTLVVTGPRAAECGALDDNLILKAARNFAERVPTLRGGAFSLDKHLPAAAGIGGGSADAAAALRLLAQANGIAADDPRLLDAARTTGADVPVCLGSSSCIMRGVGERLAPLKMPRFPCVLVNPGVPVATKDVFGAIGLKPGESFEGDGQLSSAGWPADTASFEEWIGAIVAGRNDLEQPSMQIQPVIADVLARLRTEEGCRLARMSGSGATCFGLFADDGSAARAASRIQVDHPRWWVAAGALG